MTGLDPLVGRHEIAEPADMEDLGRRMGRMLAPGDLVVLTGPLGAGKTTLTRGIGDGLGVRGPVQSPTFVIARTHPSLSGGAPLVHVDAYRLGSALELDDLDIDFERSVVVVEWGRGMVDGLRERWWEVELERATGAENAPGMERADGAGPEPVVIMHDLGVTERDLSVTGRDLDDTRDDLGVTGDDLGVTGDDLDDLEAPDPRVVTISRRPA